MVGKEVILDEKGNTKGKVIAGKTTNEFTQKAEYFSRGFRQNLMLAMNLSATATSRLNCLSSKVSYLFITRLIYTVNDIFKLYKYLSVLL